MKQDEHFLEQVRKLAAHAAMAQEEAEQYADMIEDPELKKQAQQILENGT